MGGPDGQDQGEAGGSEAWAPNTGYCTRSGTEDWLCRPLSSPAAAAEEAARFGSGSGWGDNSVAAEREEEGGSAGDSRRSRPGEYSGGGFGGAGPSSPGGSLLHRGGLTGGGGGFDAVTQQASELLVLPNTGTLVVPLLEGGVLVGLLVMGETCNPACTRVCMLGFAR